MARILTLQWDRRGVQFLLANISGKQILVEAAQTVPVIEVAEGGEEPRPDIAGTLAAAMAQYKVARLPVLVGVERSSVELLTLALPPARDEELPLLVANQAMRQSPIVTESSTIDFMALDRDPERSRHVAALVASAEEIQRVRRICTEAHLQPRRLLFRPWAAAELFLRSASGEEPVSLLVNRMAEEMDLTVVAAGQIVLTRTVRLPDRVRDSQVNARIVSEIQRTMTAVPLELTGGEEVQAIHIFGTEDEHLDLLASLREDLHRPAAAFDPFAAVETPPELVPENGGQFAGLLGMAVAEAAGSHAVDLLHPRQPPKPVNRWRLAGMAGGAVGVIVLAVAYSIWSTLAGIHSENEDRAARMRDLDKTLKKAQSQKRLIEAAARWQQEEIVWLDELRDLSLTFPPPNDVLLLRMSLRRGPSRGGAIEVQGLVRDPAVVVQLEQQIRDDLRSIRNPRVSERAVDQDYTWAFQASIHTRRRSKAAYAARASGGEQPAAAAKAPAGDERKPEPAEAKSPSPAARPEKSPGRGGKQP